LREGKLAGPRVELNLNFSLLERFTAGIDAQGCVTETTRPQNRVKLGPTVYLLGIGSPVLRILRRLTMPLSQSTARLPKASDILGSGRCQPRFRQGWFRQLPSSHIIPSSATTIPSAFKTSRLGPLRFERGRAVRRTSPGRNHDIITSFSFIRQSHAQQRLQGAG
jgi:hypothetical protein